MNTYRELQIFLIKRFIIVVTAVSIAEYGIIAIYNHTLIPFVMTMLFGSTDYEIIGIIGLALLVLLFVGNLFMGLLKMIIPEQFSYYIVTGISNLNSVIDSRLSLDRGTISDLNTSGKALLMMVLFGSLIFIIIPYILGAFFYASTVIKEIRKIEEEDRRKQREYEEKRNLMLSDIAHDLRTPITTVSGYATALSDGMVEKEKEKEYLLAIQTKSKKMSDLINLLFDFSKLDSEGFTLNKKKTDIYELVREAAAFQYQDIEDAGMELDVDIPEKSYDTEVDKVQFSRVIANLITNAIRHNKKGTKIGLFVVEDNEYLRIMVADNGDLIDKEYAKHIFEPFVMGDESRNSKGGSGLGLSIAGKIVDMHGYTIKLVQYPMIQKYAKAAEYQKMFMISIPYDN